MTRPLPLALLLLAGASGAVAATLTITGPTGGQVRIENQAVGTLPLAGPLELARGTYTVTCEATGYRDVDETVVLADDDARAHLHLRPVRLSRGTALLSSVAFAGLGQVYAGAKWRGALYAIAEAGGLLTALAGESQRIDAHDDYTLYRAEYAAAIDPRDIATYRGRSERAFQDMKDGEELRDTGLLVAAGAIAVSLLDVLLLFPDAPADPPAVVPTAFGVAPVGDQMLVQAGWKVPF